MDVVNPRPQLPPMPKPEDFGITEEDWRRYGYALSYGSTNKIDAYKEAVKAWERVCAAATSR